MCRLVGYLGRSPTHHASHARSVIRLEQLIITPEHSPIVQSYQPREMTAGLLNADGFGIGWFGHHPTEAPFTYRHVMPIWSDVNLPHLARYVESAAILAYVRSATPGQPVDLSNCQPFTHQNLLFVHNGFIEDFRRSLYRPLRAELDDDLYQGIIGNTDSEHIFALFLHYWRLAGANDLALALEKTLRDILAMACKAGVSASLNVAITDGQQLVVSRCSSHAPCPSLYWLAADEPALAAGWAIASEPLFDRDRWQAFAPQSILSVAAGDAAPQWRMLSGAG